MRVVLVPVLSDNYAYLLIDKAGTAAAVDPVEPAKVLKAAENEGVSITCILTTHHHWDHAGGNEEFARLSPGITIIGGENDGVAGCTRTVSDNEVFKMGEGHICYYCEEPGSDEKIVFTGDTLFVGGCGRCFVGTPQQMYSSLIGKLSKLPGETSVYCGHEYTLTNLKFAQKADEGNEAVAEKLAWAQAQRDADRPTIPSTIKDELATNPFLRCQDVAVARWSGKAEPHAVLAELRLRKDHFGWPASLMSHAISIEELSYNPFLRCEEQQLATFTGKSDPIEVLGATRQRKDKG